MCFGAIWPNSSPVTLVCLLQCPSLYGAVHDKGAECTIISTNRQDQWFLIKKDVRMLQLNRRLK